jgi:hypothetical protein
VRTGRRASPFFREVIFEAFPALSHVDTFEDLVLDEMTELLGENIFRDAEMPRCCWKSLKRRTTKKASRGLSFHGRHALLEPPDGLFCEAE